VTENAIIKLSKLESNMYFTYKPYCQERSQCIQSSLDVRDISLWRSRSPLVTSTEPEAWLPCSRPEDRGWVRSRYGNAESDGESRASSVESQQDCIASSPPPEHHVNHNNSFGVLPSLLWYLLAGGIWPVNNNHFTTQVIRHQNSQTLPQCTTFTVLKFLTCTPTLSGLSFYLQVVILGRTQGTV